MGDSNDNPYQSSSAPQASLPSRVAASDKRRPVPGIDLVATWKIYINVFGLAISVAAYVAGAIAIKHGPYALIGPLVVLAAPGVLWLIVGWGVALYQVLWAFVWWRQGNPQWYHHLIGAALGAACYVVLLAFVMNGYIIVD